MNAKIGQHLTLLGFCAMIFYGCMLASGQLTVEVLPQFLVTAVIFLSSGRIMRRAAAQMERDEEDKPPRSHPEPDWAWLTVLLNWSCALLIIGLMALLLMKPVGLSWSDAFSAKPVTTPYYSGAVP